MINVRDILYLFDLDGVPLHSLTDKTDLSIEHVDDEYSILYVTLPLNIDLLTEQQIVYRDNRYIITDIEEDKVNSEQNITAEISYLQLNDILRDIDMSTATVEAIAKLAVEDTQWSVGSVADDEPIHSVDVEMKTSLSTLRLLSEISDLKLRFDTMNYIIYYELEDISNIGFLFRYHKNLEEITKTTYAPKATTLFPYGKDGLTIDSVNDGKDYIEDFSWYESLGYSVEESRLKFSKTHTIEDGRYIYAGNLKRYAEKELSVLSHPQIAYDVGVSFLDREVMVGQYGYIVDEELGIKVNVKIVRLVEYEDFRNSEVELNYLVPDLSDNQQTNDSGDSSPGTQSILVMNENDVSVGENYETLIELSMTNLSDTHLSAGLSLVGQSTGNGLLEGRFTIDGRDLMVEIKQSVFEGYHTIGFPFVITQLEEGSHTIRLMLRIDNGTFTVDEHNSQLYIQSEDLSGGMSNEVPKIDIVDEVEYPRYMVRDDVEVILE